MRFLLCLAIVCSAFTHGQEPATQLAAHGFALLTHTSGEPAQAVVGGTTCDTFSLPTPGPSLTLPVDAEGKLTLPAGTLPAPPGEALGWMLAIQFTAEADGQEKRTGYDYFSKEVLDKSHTLRPPGKPSPSATIKTRAVLPVRTSRAFPLGVLPPGARFQTGIALLNDWRIDGAYKVRFLVSIEADDAPAQVLQQYDLSVEEQAGAAPPWTPLEADLAAFAGKRVTLQLDTFHLQGQAPAPNLALPLWGDPIVYTTAPPAGGGPSVLLVSLDTVRGDRLGCLGYPRGTTPSLDALARESYLFENALTPAPMTTPAHTSVFTGVSPYLHRAGVYSEGFRLSRQWAPLATLLGAQGYRTAAFTEGIALAGSIGFSRGFQAYSDGISPESHDRNLITLTFGEATAWLRRFGHLPTLLFAHTYHAHDPYTAPDAYYARFSDPAYTGQLMANPKAAKTPEERRNASDCYDAGLAFTDAKFGEFVQGLRDAGLLDNRWLIVFSDHGEEFWEHGGVAHARALYRESVHVPLLIRPPGGLPGGQRVAAPVLITDIFATVLALTKTPLPAGRESLDLLALARGEAAARGALEGFYRGYEFAKPGQPETREWETLSLRTPAYTYITTAPQLNGPVMEEIFAPLDTAERENLAETRPDLLEPAREALRKHRAQIDTQRAAPAEPKPALEQQELEALQGLGYF